MDDLNGSSKHRSKTISPIFDKKEKIKIKTEGRKKRGKTERRQEKGGESKPSQRRQKKTGSSAQKRRQTKEKKVNEGRKAKEEGQEKRGRTFTHAANPLPNTSKQIAALSRSALNSLKIISKSLSKISSVLAGSKEYSQSNLELSSPRKKEVTHSLPQDFTLSCCKDKLGSSGPQDLNLSCHEDSLTSSPPPLSSLWMSETADAHD